MAKLFGTDGIRGEANRYPMDAAMALKVGQALTHLLRKNHPQPKIIIGRDTRISGSMLECALAAGITSMGGDAILTDVLPTPGIAFVAQNVQADAGVVISASHNPYQDNGIKIFSGNGYKLTDAQEELLEELILSEQLAKSAPLAKEIGRVLVLEDAQSAYVAFVAQTFPKELSMKGLKIVLDTAHGATYQTAPAVFRDLEAKAKVIFDQPDGWNINHECGSQHTAELEKQVRSRHAALGLAFDGDGDRLIAVDEKGRVLTGDQILLICARALKAEGRLKNDLLVTTVMSNVGLHQACKKYGIKHHAAQVGDRYVLEEMKKLGSVIGGEESGHMIFLNHHTTGDGILAAVQLIAAMQKEQKPLSELADWMEVFPQKLVNVDVKHKPKIVTVPAIVAAIQEVETALGEQGRVLVRYSGTQNFCRVMVEGPSHEITEKYCLQIAEAVKETLQ
ncbi:MAG: phosphoglucosamine mutase [Desulfobacteraceae bacterium]|nr:MAG: phosphoglucosamine mutase [Desulfobacteraceae bacterium]